MASMIDEYQAALTEIQEICHKHNIVLKGWCAELNLEYGIILKGNERFHRIHKTRTEHRHEYLIGNIGEED